MDSSEIFALRKDGRETETDTHRRRERERKTEMKVDLFIQARGSLGGKNLYRPLGFKHIHIDLKVSSP